VPDRNLTGVDRVEPGEGLVGADVGRPLAPQRLQFLLAELKPARPRPRSPPWRRTPASSPGPPLRRRAPPPPRPGARRVMWSVRQQPARQVLLRGEVPRPPHAPGTRWSRSG
jgi:hypothetical protein